MTDPGPVLVFIHIPKTAGTTVTGILKRNQPPPRTRSVANVFKGGGGVKRGVTFPRLSSDRRGGLDDVRILRGHIPLGSREYLPGDHEFRYFTFLREPVDRTLSHYFNVLKTAASRSGSKQEVIAADATLEDAVAGGHVFSDLQTRMLSGLAEPFDEVTDEMLEQAKRNLRDDFAFFGLTERFDESLLLAKLRLGLWSIHYETNNRVNPERPRGEQISLELRAAAERCNRHDIELYRYAQELFDSSPELAHPDFAVELAALRAATGREDEIGAPPPGFDGDDEVWRALVADRVAMFRDERALLEIRTVLERLGRRADQALERVTAAAGAPDGR